MNFWLFLGIITFAANFSVHLLITRDFGAAVISGSAGLATAIATVFAVNWFRKQGADIRITNLRNQIRLLQRGRAEAYQAMADMVAEKERAALALNSIQDQIKHHELPGRSIPQFTPQLRQVPSWDLSAPANEEPHRVAADLASAPPSPPPQDGNLNQFLASTHATKQKIIASLNHLQTELKQLNGEIAEQRQTRDGLAHEINALMQRRQQMAESAKDLQSDLDELERYRLEMDQYLVYVEGKKQEIENGSNPLQKALKELQDQAGALQDELNHLEQQIDSRRVEKEQLDQEMVRFKHHQEQTAAKVQQEQVAPLQQELQKLQTEITPLRGDLQSLETQIRDRRQERDSLERQIAELHAQKSSLHHQASVSEPSAISSPATGSQLPPLNRPVPKSTKQPSHGKKQPLATEAEKSNGKVAFEQPLPGMVGADDRLWESQIQRSPIWQEQVRAAMGESAVEEPSGQELSDLWADFMVQLPAYEFQTLKAIALGNNPMPVIDRIAEENFTTPGELMDGINQRSADIVGEEVIHFRSGFAPPAIARDHLRTIKKLIETYEYLTE